VLYGQTKEKSKMNTKTTTTLAVLAIATVAILVSSTAIAKPALASSSKGNNGHSVSKSDLRGVGNFLKCIANHGGNDISKKKAQDCVDNHLG
jgi:hypothetical protein